MIIQAHRTRGSTTAYQRIVFGTDGSITARRAEAVALALAALLKSELIIVSAYDRDRSQAERWVAAAKTRAVDKATSIVSIAVPGEPSEVLQQVADERDAGLLVLGSRGMTGVGRLLGSIPDRVSHSSPCDLLIVQTGRERDLHPDPRVYKKILLTALVPAASTSEAARRGADLARTMNADSVMLYLPEVAALGTYLTELQAELGLDPASGISVDGDPADAVVSAAEREGFDLIVVANTGMSEGRLHVGAVPNKISHKTQKDLLIVNTES